MLPTVIAGSRRLVVHESLRHVMKINVSSGGWYCACQQAIMPARRVVLGNRWYADVAGPNGPDSGQDQEAGRSDSASSSGRGSVATDTDASETSDDASDALAHARDTWRVVVQGKPEHSPPRVSSLRRWIGKKIALHHIRSVLEDDGKLDDAEEELLRGAPLCLQFLANEALDRETFSPSTSSLQPPFIEEALGNRLRDMMAALRAAGHTWSWELLDIEEVSLQRLFVIVGGSRGGNLGTTGIMGAFGQQFVLTEEQTRRFLDKQGGLQSRMGVLQELMLSNMVLIGDVSLRVSQRSQLGCDKHEATSSNDIQSATVEHMLRLEMALNQVRNYDDGEMPALRPSSWHIADWNWACIGNHPSLPPGVPAPW